MALFNSPAIAIDPIRWPQPVIGGPWLIGSAIYVAAANANQKPAAGAMWWVYKSTDNGQTWTLPNSANIPLDYAVTDAVATYNPNVSNSYRRIYLLAVRSSDGKIIADSFNPQTDLYRDTGLLAGGGPYVSPASGMGPLKVWQRPQGLELMMAYRKTNGSGGVDTRIYLYGAQDILISTTAAATDDTAPLPILQTVSLFNRVAVFWLNKTTGVVSVANYPGYPFGYQPTDHIASNPAVLAASEHDGKGVYGLAEVNNMVRAIYLQPVGGGLAKPMIVSGDNNTNVWALKQAVSADPMYIQDATAAGIASDSGLATGYYFWAQTPVTAALDRLLYSKDTGASFTPPALIYDAVANPVEPTTIAQALHALSPAVAAADQFRIAIGLYFPRSGTENLDAAFWLYNVAATSPGGGGPGGVTPPDTTPPSNPNPLPPPASADQGYGPGPRKFCTENG